MPFKSEDIAYFAGLFEGEGTVFIAKYYWLKDGKKRIRKTPQMKLRISMTDKEPLLRVQLSIGGRINGPYQYKKCKNSLEKYKQFWVLDFDSPLLVKEIIKNIAVYMSPRRLKQLNYESISI